jgi:uncharacterized alpha-E superfamily protein
MLHDEALDFIWLGVLLERVSQTARTLDVHYHAFSLLPERHEVVLTALWLSLLRALSGSEPFMKRHQGRVSHETVARFLVDEIQFPRSIAYCVRSARDRFDAIRPRDQPGLPGGTVSRRLAELDEWLASRRDRRDGTPLHDVLTHVVDEVHAACGDLGREMLGYT